jgi:hypothetical protein
MSYFPPGGGGLKFARVEYTGDGQQSHVINVGFKPRFIIILMQAQAYPPNSQAYIIYFSDDDHCFPYDGNPSQGWFYIYYPNVPPILPFECEPPPGQHFRVANGVDVGSLDHATPALSGFVAAYGHANDVGRRYVLYAFG